MIKTATCLTCKNEFSRHIRHGKMMFCSPKCYHDSNKGISPRDKSEKWHLAIVESNKKKVWTPEAIEQSRQRILKHATGWNKGKKINNTEGWGTWKGGISRKYYKRITLERDNYTCQVCGLFDQQIMHVDHVQPVYFRPDLKHDLSNLVTLCPNCHARKTHTEWPLIAKDRKEKKAIKKLDEQQKDQNFQGAQIISINKGFGQ